MNPYYIEGCNISLDTWRWLYLRKDEDIKIPLDKTSSKHSKILARHDLLVRQKGRFHLTELSREVLSRAVHYDRQLQSGVPLSHKTTFTNLRIGVGSGWVKSKTKEKKVFHANDEIIIFHRNMAHAIPVLEPLSSARKVLIPKIRQLVFSEGYLELHPRALQRVSFFEPGAIWFRGEAGDAVAIKEVYYDLIAFTCKETMGFSMYVKISLDKDYIVVLNQYTPYRYLEDIVAIVDAYKIEELDKCVI